MQPAYDYALVWHHYYMYIMS